MLRVPALLLLCLAGLHSNASQGIGAYRGIPFDTALVVATTPTLSIDLETGGAIRVIGGTSRVLRVHVTGGQLCPDCGVAVTHT